jgi:hypothetical protein
MLGGAAGALAGLVFVGLSLHAVFVLIPQQGLHALGIEPIIGGIAVGVLFALLAANGARNARADRDRDGGGLYVLVAAGIVGLAMNVFGAWSLLIGLARES